MIGIARLLEGFRIVVEADGDRIGNPFGVDSITAGETIVVDGVPD